MTKTYSGYVYAFEFLCVVYVLRAVFAPEIVISGFSVALTALWCCSAFVGLRNSPMRVPALLLLPLLFGLSAGDYVFSSLEMTKPIPTPWYVTTVLLASVASSLYLRRNNHV